jgi:hypothetical protein
MALTDGLKHGDLVLVHPPEPGRYAPFLARVDCELSPGDYLVRWDEDNVLPSTMHVPRKHLELVMQEGEPILLKIRFENEQDVAKARELMESIGGETLWDSTQDGDLDA